MGQTLICPIEYFNGVFFLTTNRESFLYNERVAEVKRVI